VKSVWGKSISIIPALLVLVMQLLLAPPGNAQTGNPAPPAPAGPTTPPPASIRERQFKMLEMEREAAKPRTPEEETLALAQIAEDYKRIQVINNKMMSTTMPAAAPNYASIADTTAEIRKRASRLRDNLRLPQGASEKVMKPPEYKQAVDAARMKAALLSLDGSIMRFINNPIFKNTGVVEVEQAARARRDLDTIIEFSRLIKKDAERLSKPSEKPD